MFVALRRVVNLLNATDANPEVVADLVRYRTCETAIASTELDAWLRFRKEPARCVQKPLVLCNATLFPHIKRILCRVAALFIGIASVERTYAGLQRIKTCFCQVLVLFISAEKFHPVTRGS